MADADGRAGVLTGRQLALGRNDLIQQHGVGHELVVVGSFGIFEDVAQLLQVRGAQIERHVAVGGLRQQFETRGVHLQDFTSGALDDLHVILRQKTVLGFVLPHGERLLINKVSHNGSLFMFVVSISLQSLQSLQSAPTLRPPRGAEARPRFGNPPELKPCKNTKNNPDCATISGRLLFFSQKGE